jgi:sulfur-oxidizing protein SoxX
MSVPASGPTRRRVQQSGFGGATAAAWLTAFLAGSPMALQAGPEGEVVSYLVTSDRIDVPLTDRPPDPLRGRLIAIDTNRGNCTICHAMPIPEVPAFGNVGPPLDGVGIRLTAAQLRLRLVDARRLNPDSVMPAYYRVDGLYRVGVRYEGKPLLDAQSVEDLVAYLRTLQ